MEIEKFLSIDKYIDWLFDLCEKKEADNEGIMPEKERAECFLPNKVERINIAKQIDEYLLDWVGVLENSIIGSVLSESEILEMEYINMSTMTLKFDGAYIHGAEISISEGENYADLVRSFGHEIARIKYFKFVVTRINDLKVPADLAEDRLVWKGSMVDLTALITELIKTDKIEQPVLREYPNISRLAKQVLNAFKGKEKELNFHTIQKGLDPKSPKQKKSIKIVYCQ
jgi:hypothetical protein